MAVIYLRSTDGSDADNGSTWALAKATLTGAYAAMAPGDICYMADGHAESSASALTLTSPGTAASPCLVLCVDDTGDPQPPTALATTGTITTTGSAAQNFAGFAYFYGVNFICGSGVSNASMGFAATTPWWHRLDTCKLKIGDTHISSRINIGAGASTADDQLLELINTTFEFGATAQGLVVRCPFKWLNTPSAIAGSTFPTTLFQAPAAANTALIDLRGVDLSALGSSTLFDISQAFYHRYYVERCKFGTSYVISSGSLPGQGGSELTAINSDSGDTNWKYTRKVFQGTITDETTIVRTGGATDGTTHFSRKMATTADAKYFSPLESEPVVFWNETVGSSVTVTFPVVTDNVTLTDAEAWVEVEYLGTSGFPLGAVARDRSTNILTTAANQTTDGTSTWTTTGLTTPVKQSLSVSFTPQEKGPVRARVMLAKASTTLYFDPLILASSGRQYMVGNILVNEAPTGGSSTVGYSRGRVVNARS